ncbi:MAG: NAD+ synthase [Bacteroidota bacterium]
MRIAIAQINPTVGDLRGNSHRILDFAQRANGAGAELVVFPELCVTGYPPQDLLDNSAFLEAVEKTVDWIAHAVPAGLGVLIGAPVINTSRFGKRLRNAAILLEDGRRVTTVHKTLLPSYDVFDEHRYFEPASERSVVEWRGRRLGIHICEDMWNASLTLEGEHVDYHLYDVDPIHDLIDQGADILINISASPFSLGKHDRRNDFIRDICQHHGVPFVLANQVGANTELIFDGDSRVHRADGSMVACAASFAEDLLLWDMDADQEPCTLAHSETEDLLEALTLGVRDYFQKTGFFDKIVLGLSGGIDSAVTCAIATMAVGPERVVGVTMPSEISSRSSVDDSAALARNLGIEFLTIPIKPAVGAFDSMLSDVFEGTERGVAEENIQSRSRGLTLMALSNKFSYLLLSTGNKSEMAVGYVTLYGDTNGGLAVLSDVYKHQVYDLARLINRQQGREVIPESTITKPPSAELRPGQKDEDTLPSYDVLDHVLQLYIEELLEHDEIIRRTGYDADTVAWILRSVDNNEYKRRQAPPGLRVSMKAFGIGRRLPIVMRWNRGEVREIVDHAERALS